MHYRNLKTLVLDSNAMGVNISSKQIAYPVDAIDFKRCITYMIQYWNLFVSDFIELADFSLKILSSDLVDISSTDLDGIGASTSEHWSTHSTSNSLLAP